MAYAMMPIWMKFNQDTLQITEVSHTPIHPLKSRQRVRVPVQGREADLLFAEIMFVVGSRRLVSTVGTYVLTNDR